MTATLHHPFEIENTSLQALFDSEKHWIEENHARYRDKTHVLQVIAAIKRRYVTESEKRKLHLNAK